VVHRTESSIRRWLEAQRSAADEAGHAYLGLTGVGRWLLANGSTVFRSRDFYAGIVSFLVVLVVALLSDSMRSAQQPVLFAAAALGAAFLGVALTALAIIATFLDDHYRAVLKSAPGGVRDAFMPYAIVAAIAAIAVCSGLIGASLSPALPSQLNAVFLAVTVGSTVWAVVGTVQLVFLTVFHGVQRARLHETIQETAELLKQRQTKRPA
jgi:hypothetical protein